MHKKLTFWGASPIIFFLSIVYTIPVIILNYFFKPFFEIIFIQYRILVFAAIVLLCLGIPLYFITLRILKTAFKKKELITTGIFSICRNPLFAVVIFLLLPGIALLFKSWLLLTIPCFVYIMFRLFIHREELLIEKTFGQEYTDYKNRTPAIFPRIWKCNKT